MIQDRNNIKPIYLSRIYHHSTLMYLYYYCIHKLIFANNKNAFKCCQATKLVAKFLEYIFFEWMTYIIKDLYDLSITKMFLDLVFKYSFGHN